MARESKEVREIIEKLEAQGWRIERNPKTGYTFAYPPDKTKRPVKLPTSPGQYRWKQNLIAVLRRNGADL